MVNFTVEPALSPSLPRPSTHPSSHSPDLYCSNAPAPPSFLPYCCDESQLGHISFPSLPILVSLGSIVVTRPVYLSSWSLLYSHRGSLSFISGLVGQALLHLCPSTGSVMPWGTSKLTLFQGLPSHASESGTQLQAPNSVTAHCVTISFPQHPSQICHCVETITTHTKQLWEGGPILFIPAHPQGTGQRGPREVGDYQSLPS